MSQVYCVVCDMLRRHTTNIVYTPFEDTVMAISKFKGSLWIELLDLFYQYT